MEGERNLFHDQNRVSMGHPSVSEEMVDTRNVDGDSAIVRVGDYVIFSSQVKKVILHTIMILEQDCPLKTPETPSHHHPHSFTRSEEAKLLPEEYWQSTPLGDHSRGTPDFYQKDLSQVINGSSKLSDRVLISILQKIASGVQHLHDLDRPHGKLIAESVSISCDGRYNPFIWEAGEEDIASTKEQDIRDLGKLFYFVATNGEIYPGVVSSNDMLCPLEETAQTSRELAETAKNLIEKMMQDNPITIDEVLRHPVFWSDQEKINCLTEVYDSVSHSRESLETLQDQATNVFEGNWITKLPLNTKEMDELREKEGIKKPFKDKIMQKAGGTKTIPKKNVELGFFMYNGTRITELRDTMEMKKWERCRKNLKTAKKENVNDDKENAEPNNNVQGQNAVGSETNSEQECNIHKLIAKKFPGIQREEYEVNDKLIIVTTQRDGGYCEDSLYDLLRFIRNRKAHYWEGDSSQERTYYRTAGGFWNFYSKRFPKLLAFVYDEKNHFPYYQQQDHTSS